MRLRGGEDSGRVDEEEGGGPRVLGGKKSAGGEGRLWWRPMESDEERAAPRGGEREIGRAAATRETHGGVGEDRKRKRETETDSVLDPPGIDAFVCQNAETPASFLPSFLPSLFSSLLFSSAAVLSYSVR